MSAGGIEGSPVVYRRRWYILMIFSFHAMFQCTVWNTWGPVETVALKVFPFWRTADISNFANWGNYVLFPFFIPCMWFVNRSLRLSVLLGSFLMAAGAGLRCVKVFWPGEVSDLSFTVLCHLSACLNGVAGIIFCSAPPAVSATWFPASERVTATSIGQMFNGLGAGLGFLIARLFVSTEEPANIPQLTREINHYLLFLAAPPLLFLLCVLLYFPSAPPSPPSESAQLERVALVPSTRRLLANRSAWVLAIVVCLSQSVVGTWSAMMVTNLSQISVEGSTISQQWVDVLGMVGSLSNTCTAIAAARLTDKLRGHMKTSIFVLLSLASVFFTGLTLVSVQVIQLPSFVSLQIAIASLYILGSVAAQTTSPLLLEFTVEVCYPVSEVVSGGWIFIWYGLGSMVFLLIFLIPGIGAAWLNYILPLSCVVCLPLLGFVKEEYNRMSVDNVI